MAIETLSWTGMATQPATIATTGYTGVATAGGDAYFEDTWIFRNRPTLRMDGTTAQGQLYGYHDMPDTDKMAYEQAFEVIEIPTIEQALLTFGNGEARQISVAVISTGRLRVRDGGGADAFSTPVGSLVPGGRYIAQFFFVRHATAGSFRLVMADENGVPLPNCDSGMLTGRNTGSQSITRVKSSQSKSFSTSTVTSDYRFGRPRWDVDANDILPAPTSHKPFYLFENGQYVPKDVLRWNGSQYVSVLA